MEKLRSLPCPPPNPIACRTCGKVFSDNVSLLFHLECHRRLVDKTPLFGPHTSVQGERVLPSCFPSPLFHSSSMERTSRACPLHVTSAFGLTFQTAQPMSNAGFSLPVTHTTMFKKKNVFRGLNPVTTPMMLDGGCSNNLQVMPRKKNHVKEAVVVSEDEEKENEIDLTLKL